MTLRPAPGHALTIRIFRIDPTFAAPVLGETRRDSLLAEVLREFSYVEELQPGYIELDLGSVPELVSQEGRVRIEVEPATPGVRLWAFVTVTHNQTQHVTVIAPHSAPAD